MFFWIHEISQTALAAAVATLGCVIMLELRSIARLRRSVDGHLERVFEQLDLLRFESQQLLEAQSHPPSSPGVPANGAPGTAGTTAVTSYSPPPPAPGEARLIAALTAARARLGRNGSGVL